MILHNKLLEIYMNIPIVVDVILLPLNENVLWLALMGMHETVNIMYSHTVSNI